MTGRDGRKIECARVEKDKTIPSQERDIQELVIENIQR